MALAAGARKMEGLCRGREGAVNEWGGQLWGTDKITSASALLIHEAHRYLLQHEREAATRPFGGRQVELLCIRGWNRERRGWRIKKKRSRGNQVEQWRLNHPPRQKTNHKKALKTPASTQPIRHVATPRDATGDVENVDNMVEFGNKNGIYRIFIIITTTSFVKLQGISHHFSFIFNFNNKPVVHHFVQ